MSAELSNPEVRGSSVARHEAQCTVCRHLQRQEIEERWLDWYETDWVAAKYDISRDALYRHAHAFDLFRKRAGNVRRVVERMIEHAGYATLTGSTVIAAIKLLLQMNQKEQACEQTESPDPKNLLERMSKEEREAFAKDGSLPPWFSGAKAATPLDIEGAEKGS